jgi:hypothetical protein
VVWQIVGVWRAAGQHRARGGRRFWAIIARIAVVVSALQALGAFVESGVPQIADAVKVLAGDPGRHEIRLLPSGTELAFAGGISFGVTDEIRQALDAAPRVTILHLNSPGGRVVEARLLHDLIRERGLVTYAAKLCASACTVAFLGGRQRYIASDARLGFHQPASAGDTQDSGRALDDLVREQNHRRALDDLLRDGVDPAFAERAASTPNAAMWYPTADELLQAHVITGVLRAGAASGGAPRAEAGAERDAAQRLGFYGRWAIDCRAPAAPANPILTMTRDGDGTAAYHMSMGGSPPDFDTRIRELRLISERELSFSFAIRDTTQHVVATLSPGRLRTLQSWSDDGKVPIKDGVLASSGKETPFFEKCD